MPRKAEIRRAMQVKCVAALSQGIQALKKVRLTVKGPRNNGCCWLPATSRKVASFKFDTEGLSSSMTLLDLEYLFRCSRKADAEDMEVKISVDRRKGKRQVTRICLQQFLSRLQPGIGHDPRSLVIYRSGVTLKNGELSTCAPVPEWPFEGQVIDRNEPLFQDHDKHFDKVQPLTDTNDDFDIKELDRDINEIYMILEELPMNIKDETRHSAKDTSVLHDCEDDTLRELDAIKDEVKKIAEELKKYRKDENKQSIWDSVLNKDEHESQLVDINLDSDSSSSDYTEWETNNYHDLYRDQMIYGTDVENDKSTDRSQEASSDETEEGTTLLDVSSGSRLMAGVKEVLQYICLPLLVNVVLIEVTAMVDQLLNDQEQ